MSSSTPGITLATTDCRTMMAVTLGFPLYSLGYVMGLPCENSVPPTKESPSEKKTTPPTERPGPRRKQ